MFPINMVVLASMTWPDAFALVGGCLAMAWVLVTLAKTD